MNLRVGATTGLMPLALLLGGCWGGTPTVPPPVQTTAQSAADEMPGALRKLMPRSQTATLYELESAASAYAGENPSAWNARFFSDEALQKHVTPVMTEHRVIEGWVGRLTYVLHAPNNAEEGAPVVRQLCMQLPARFLDRYPIYLAAENYDRQSGYYPVSESEVKKFKSGEWVKFSGVLQPDALPHWNIVQPQNDDYNNSYVWVGTITLTELSRATGKAP